MKDQFVETERCEINPIAKTGRNNTVKHRTPDHKTLTDQQIPGFLQKNHIQ
jgi:hypothetical protein